MRVLDWRLHGGPDVLVHLIARAGSLDVEMVRSVMEARRLLLAESGRLAAARRSEEQAALLASLAEQLAAAERRGGAAPRLRVLRRADRGGRQRRLPARHELDPGAVPGEPRAVPAARVGAPTRTPTRRGRCAEGDGDAARPRSSPGSRPRRSSGCWRRCREGPLPARGVDLRRRSPTPSRCPRRRSRRCAATDAVEGFDAWLGAAPQANRTAIRAALLGLGTRLRGRDRAERAAALRALDAHARRRAS